ncbi:hypothetical protein [Amycolatopsis sp. NPDC051128]|uniref:hypothetical protein n=1 Tax=Amycolatopsis sp. NPDC051128 TaxID=3155412 RepID=UPI003438A931
MTVYAVISFAREPAEIVTQGVMSRDVFQRLFLDRYEFGGERYHPADDWTVLGALLAVDGAILVTIPVWTWTGRDGVRRFLCQATDDGSAPALSVLALSERELLNRLNEQLRE